MTHRKVLETATKSKKHETIVEGNFEKPATWKNVPDFVFSGKMSKKSDADIHTTHTTPQQHHTPYTQHTTHTHTHTHTHNTHNKPHATQTTRHTNHTHTPQDTTHTTHKTPQTNRDLDSILSKSISVRTRKTV